MLFTDSFILWRSFWFSALQSLYGKYRQLNMFYGSVMKINLISGNKSVLEKTRALSQGIIDHVLECLTSGWHLNFWSDIKNF